MKQVLQTAFYLTNYNALSYRKPSTHYACKKGSFVFSNVDDRLADVNSVNPIFSVTVSLYTLS
ncbi:MAG: hypothetical protein PSX36_06560 [bacterium]|nr:hypothetical protein [bacterium]